MTQMLTTREKQTKIQELLRNQQGNISKMLPEHLKPERMVRIAYQTIIRTPKLLDCTPGSLVAGVVEASTLGLEIDGVTGHAYLVPYGDKAQLIPGYKGLIKLAMQTGEVGKIDARIVYNGDEFEYSFGLNEQLRHVPSGNTSPEEIVAVYAVAHLKDGTPPKFDVMSRAEVEAVRAKSRAGKSGPWVTDYGEMAKKTVIRRLCKTLPQSVELSRAVALDERAERGIDQEIPPIDVDVEVQDAAADANGSGEDEQNTEDATDA